MIEISVVVPCRDDGATLVSCLAALARQTLDRPRFEILLIDGSNDSPNAVLGRRFGARILTDGRRAGPGAARNVGIRASRGAIVAFTDADCEPADDWLEQLLAVFAEDARRVGVAGDLRMPRGTLIGHLEDLEARAYYRGFITSNVAYRRSALREAGGFDERLSCAEDYDLAWRMIDRGRDIVHDPRPVVLHRPPEVEGSLSTYLRKQLWYARHDVPTHAAALARARRAPSPGSIGAAHELRRNAAQAAMLLAAASAPVFHRVGALSLAALAGAATSRVARAARFAGERLTPREMVTMSGVVVARRMARALGTALGAADLALRPTTRRALRGPPSEPALSAAPPAARSPRPRAA